MRNYTPGPWHLFAEQTTTLEPLASRPTISKTLWIMAGQRKLAILCNSLSKEETPNGLLIAASPELLTAAMRVLLNHGPEEIDDHNSDWVALETAIAKATGRGGTE